ncbi:MAG: hypothetical protein AVDCRST_MAG77-4409 [uncultured Chloroflexi bacterium]|uniref:Uncharacterized protein n=1 Tax=uncultured Chloroflexota bacterium TaxID=166587 RepID=A0A6J4JU61_9CHLR|nr:MAG: hypothetical protein AVDCRST_MAG77-4409 [uncultured Chloroflexota bacterium]
MAPIPDNVANGTADVRWAPRLPQGRLRRLYALDALGVIDDELIDHVGYALEARCRSILAVHDAQRGRVHCPCCARCAREERTRLISHAKRPEELLRCPDCGWQTTWGDYQRTFQHKQLNAGGAVRAFEAFPHHFHQAIGPRQKMVAIDRLIHEFHYSLKDQPDAPTRIAGVNLVEGTMTEVIALLEELAYGSGTTHEISATAHSWRENEQRRRELWTVLATRSVQSVDE